MFGQYELKSAMNTLFSTDKNIGVWCLPTFWHREILKMAHGTPSLIIGMLLLLSNLNSCATYRPQSNIPTKQEATSKTPVHTFFVAGGLGTTTPYAHPELQQLLKSYLDQANKNSSLLYVGNYIPKNTNINTYEPFIKAQIDLAKDFRGKIVFTPGHFEWHSEDTKIIEWTQDYLKTNDLKNFKVRPKNACPLEYVELDDTLDVLYVDSNWFEMDWNRVKGINEKCPDINTKRRFNEAFEKYIKNSRGKNLLIVMHQPIFSNGKHAGKETFKEAMAFPVAGTVIKEIKRLGDLSKMRSNTHQYNQLQATISALVQDNDRVTIVSGKDESLQYLTSKNIRQIISGALGSRSGTKRSKGTIANIGGSLNFEGQFTYGENGFAIINYYEDGASDVSFITTDTSYRFDLNEQFPPEKEDYPIPTFSEPTKTVAVTTDKHRLEKSGFYKFLWGQHYRSYFGTPVTAPIAVFDTLYSGMNVTKQSGGHQSFSARLQNREGKDFAMRGLQKDALKFLRFKVPGIAYDDTDFKNSFAETVVFDFFSTSHPFMQLVVDPLAESVAINHAKPQLYYLPKQPGFRFLGDDYGDQLYFIEERPMMAQKDYKGFNRANPSEKGEAVNFESTTDVLEKLNRSEKYAIDQRTYIRARLFDMLIGDWDRHEGQWRWIEYEINKDQTLFIPIPKDRDAAFSKFEGLALPIIKMLVPDVRFWQSYDTTINSVKWFNAEANNLDIAFLNKYDTSVWIEEAKFIQTHMTDAAIDRAFKWLPVELQDSTSEDLKNKLKGRLKNLDDIAKRYGDLMQKLVVIHGTHKKDKIEITRLPQGKTNVIVKRIKSSGKEPIYFERTFDKKDTKEIWIYGLNNDDIFEVSGKGDNEIMIRLIGGYGDDVFDISNTKKLKVYDWKHEKATFTNKIPAKQFTPLYETNMYSYREFKENSNVLFPYLGFRTDDGVLIGIKNTFTNHGFNGVEFRHKHSISANYFFNFNAFEIEYDGQFANIMPQWNYEILGYYTSPQFANNYFGYGNDTKYDKTEVGKNYNRARIEQFKLRTGLAYKSLQIHALFENYKLEENPNRLFTTDNFENDIFETQNYVGAEANFLYEHADAMDFPTQGLYINAVLGYKNNLKLKNNHFGYAGLKLGFDKKLIPSGDLVLGSKAEVKTNFKDGVFFYHAPSIGGNSGLRGYRNERFTGKTAFYHSTDIKLRLKRYITMVAPITIGIYGGFDYGRVWTKNDTSSTWHQALGGGFWVGSLNAFSINAGYFKSREDAIIQVGLGFGF